MREGAKHESVLLGIPNSTSQREAPHEATLTQRLIQKDVRAFEELYDLHSRTVYSLVRRIIGQPSTAEEVVQDVFLHLWRHAAQYNPERGSFVPWLLTLARNCALDHLRLKSERQRRREDFTDVMTRFAISPRYEEVLDQKRQAERVQALMGSLQPRQKQAIELAYFGGLSHSEIAEALKEPLGTVKTWIRNGLQRLKEGLQATT